MNPLKEAIQLMGKEDIRAFKLYSNRTDQGGERQDLKLFDLLRDSGEDYNEAEVYEELYAGMAKNTFHRLKSRLLGEMNRSLVHQYLDKYDALKVFHLLSIVEFYMQKRHYGLAHWYLRKTERVALKLDHFEALDIVYSEFIRLAREGLVNDPEDYIRKRSENQEKLHRLRQLDDVLVMVMHRVKLTQNYGGKGSELMALLQDTVSEFSRDGILQQAPKMRFRMFDAISQILLGRGDFETLATYCKSSFDEFEADGLFSRNTHRTKLMIFTFLANSHFKLEEYDTSMYYAGRLHAAMKAFDGFLYDQFQFFYYNVLVINYFKLDLDKALSTLEEMFTNEKIMEAPFYVVFVYLNLALVWNEKKNFRKSVGYFIKLGVQEAFKSADPGLKLRIAVGELMVRHELGEYEVIIQRLRQVRKEYVERLQLAEFKRELALLELIDGMNETMEPKRDKKLLKKARKFLALVPSEDQSDAEVIEYNEFVKRKMGI